MQKRLQRKGDRRGQTVSTCEESGVGGICIPCCGVGWDVPLVGVRSEWTLIDKVPGVYRCGDVEPEKREDTETIKRVGRKGVYTALMGDKVDDRILTLFLDKRTRTRAAVQAFQDVAPLSGQLTAWRGGE
jgi:hypothetical protein